jgi:hypothetical protein
MKIQKTLPKPVSAGAATTLRIKTSAAAGAAPRPKPCSGYLY